MVRRWPPAARSTRAIQRLGETIFGTAAQTRCFEPCVELRGDGDFDGHAFERVSWPAKAAHHRQRLADVTRNSDGDEVRAAHTPVGRIEGDPASARQVD